MRAIVIRAAFLLTGAHGAAARLSPSADQEFSHYIAVLESRMAAQHANPDTYLAALRSRQLLSGGLEVEPVNGGLRSLSGALLHHWRAAALVRGATPKDM